MNDKNNALIEAVKSDAYNRLKRLLEAGGDPNTEDSEGRPLAYLAIRHGAEADTLALLLQSGADIAWCTEEGVGLLDEAVERNRIDLATLLIDRGIDPAGTRRQSGLTPLMLAACFDYIEMMDLLYARGADLYAQDSLGMTAADYARKLRRKRAQAWIEEKMENPFG